METRTGGASFLNKALTVGGIGGLALSQHAYTMVTFAALIGSVFLIYQKRKNKKWVGWTLVTFLLIPLFFYGTFVQSVNFSLFEGNLSENFVRLFFNDYMHFGSLETVSVNGLLLFSMEILTQWHILLMFVGLGVYVLVTVPNGSPVLLVLLVTIFCGCFLLNSSPLLRFENIYGLILIPFTLLVGMGLHYCWFRLKKTPYRWFLPAGNVLTILFMVIMNWAKVDASMDNTFSVFEKALGIAPDHSIYLSIFDLDSQAYILGNRAALRVTKLTDPRYQKAAKTLLNEKISEPLAFQNLSDLLRSAKKKKVNLISLYPEIISLRGQVAQIRGLVYVSNSKN